MKRIVKAAVQSVVAVAAPALLRMRGGKLLVLMYHRVLPEDHPEREVEQAGMFVSPRTLAMHLRVLRRHFELVHIEDWVDAARRGVPMADRCCAITFDDGWRDNYQYAYPVLREARAPATIYLVTDKIGTNYSFWPNRLARLLSGPFDAGVYSRLPEHLARIVASIRGSQPSDRGLDRARIDSIIVACKAAYSDAQMLDALSALESSAAVERDLMSAEEIREMASSGLIRFGSHTRRHTRLLSDVPPETLRDEIEGSRAAMLADLGLDAATFCYPNGDSCAAAVDIVRNCYRAAVTTRPGWNAADSDLHSLARIGMHDDVSATQSAFLSRLAGVG